MHWLETEWLLKWTCMPFRLTIEWIKYFFQVQRACQAVGHCHKQEIVFIAQYSLGMVRFPMGKPQTTDDHNLTIISWYSLIPDMTLLNMQA